LEEFFGLLAYHYAQAEAWEQAQAYLLKAGDQAAQVAAGAEALTHYRRAVEAYENAFGSKWDPLQRAELASKMGEAYYGLGRLPESREYFQDALALLDRPLPQTRLGLLGGLVGQVIRQALHRLRPSRFLDSAPAEERKALREAVRVYERLGVIFYIEGEAASSIYAFLRSLNLAEPAGPSPELARAYANNVIASGLIPPLRNMADRYSQLALETASSGEDLAALAWVYQLTGIYNIGVGRWVAAIDAEEQAADIDKRIGRLRWREESLGTLAQALHISGDFVRSRKLYLEMHTSSQERGDRQTQVWALAGQAETGLRLGGSGHREELIGYLEQAQALLAEYRYPNRPDEIQIISLIAQVRLRQGEWDLAKQAATRAAELIASEWPPSAFYTFEAYAGLPVVYMGLWQAEMKGQYPAAESVDLKNSARKACRSLHLYARVFPIAKPRAWLWQGSYDWLVNKRDKAHEYWQKSLDKAESLEMPYDVGLAHYEIGRHLPESNPARKEHLEQALQIFSELRAAWDFARARQELRN
jgi:tetratricopeptide (TPR) repeat protein